MPPSLHTLPARLAACFTANCAGARATTSSPTRSGIRLGAGKWSAPPAWITSRSAPSTPRSAAAVEPRGRSDQLPMAPEAAAPAPASCHTTRCGWPEPSSNCPAPSDGLSSSPTYVPVSSMATISEAARLTICIDVATAWQSAAQSGLRLRFGLSRAEVAFPGNPTPWSSWVGPILSALDLPPQATPWPRCVGGEPRDPALTPQLTTPALAPPPPAAPRQRRLGPRAPRAPRQTRGSRAGKHPRPAPATTVVSLFRALPRTPPVHLPPRAPPSPRSDANWIAGRRRPSPRHSPRAAPPCPPAARRQLHWPDDDMSDAQAPRDQPRSPVEGDPLGRPRPEPD